MDEKGLLLRAYLQEVVDANDSFHADRERVLNLMAADLGLSHAGVSEAIVGMSFRVALGETNTAILQKIVFWRCSQTPFPGCVRSVREAFEASILKSIDSSLVWLVAD